jgi:hypothetical protein
MRRLATALVTAGIVISTQVGVTALADTATAATPAPTLTAAAPSTMPAAAKYKFKNCTAMNKVYPHGVGRKGARDHTSGKKVTTFKVSTSLYNKIIRYRSGLDRDKDGIACERA